MAASETQFQPATIQATGYTPSEYHPANINVPTGAGQLWANLGKTALDAAAQFNQTAQMMQQSPLNPAVQAKMDYDSAQYDAAQQHIQDVQAMGPLGQVIQKTGPQGLETVPIASIQDPTLAARLTAQMGLTPSPGGGGSGAPQVNNPTIEQKEQPAQPTDRSTLYGGLEERNAGTGAPATTQPPQQPPQPPTRQQMVQPPKLSLNTLVPSQGGSTAALSAGGTGQLNTGQPQDPDIVATPAPQRGGSIWSPLRPSPGAPAAPTGPQPQNVQGPPSGSPAAATQADQAAMQKWQEQNAHPVMSSQDALGWMKNFDTGVQRATYLPMGGPGGAPAFAFHMKGGGINTVPVSQMVSRGGGPLVAAQNTSQVISATDQQQQGGDQGYAQSAAATGAAPAQQPNLSPPPPANLPQYPNVSPPPPANLPTPPNISPPPPANLPQYPNVSPPPPPAPNGQPQFGPQGQLLPPAQGGQIWNPLVPAPELNAPPPAPTGPLPGARGTLPAPPAPGTPAALLAAARMPITDAQGNPISAYANVPSKGGLSPDQLAAQTAPAGAPAQPADTRDMWERVQQADQAAVQAQANAMGPAPKGEYQGNRIVQGTQGPYTYYIDDEPGSPSVGRVYTVMPGPAGEYYNQQRWYLGSNQYKTYELPDSLLRKTVADYWIPSGSGPSRQWIDHASPEQLKPWARQAWINQHTQPTPADAGTNKTLDTNVEYINSLKKMGDILQTFAAHGQTRLSSADLLGSKIKNAAVAAGVGPIDPAQTEPQAAALRDLEEEADKAQGLAKDPNLLIRLGQAAGVDLPLKYPAEMNIGTPSSNAITDAAFSGRDIPIRINAINSLIKAASARYGDLIDTQQDNMQRVADRHVNNRAQLVAGKDIPDEGDNQYKAHDLFPGELKTVSPEEYPAFAKAHPNTRFQTRGGQIVWTP